MSANLGEASRASAQSCPATRAVERIRAGGSSLLSGGSPKGGKLIGLFSSTSRLPHRHFQQ
jgi:hypothetical protein